MGHGVLSHLLTDLLRVLSHRRSRFLRRSRRELFERATSGFLSRLRASSLNYPEEFGDALDAHLDRVRARAS